MMSRYRDLVLKLVKLRHTLLDRVQAFRLPVGQRTQQHTVEDAEHGRVRADCQRQSENGHHCERRIAQEAANGISKIVNRSAPRRSIDEGARQRLGDVLETGTSFWEGDWRPNVAPIQPFVSCVRINLLWPTPRERVSARIRLWGLSAPVGWARCIAVGMPGSTAM